MEESKAIPIENLMDSSLDDIADLPAFVVPPVGHYHLTLSLESKSINDKPAIQANWVVDQTVELKDKTAVATEVGTKFNSLFMMDNEFGQGAFKALLMPLKEGLGLGGLRIHEILSKVQNVKVKADLKHRKDKNDADKIYPNVQNVELI